MAAKDPTTSLQVHESTRRLLDALKSTGQTYEELILEMVEEHFPASLVQELELRFGDLRGPTAAQVLRRAGV